MDRFIAQVIHPVWDMIGIGIVFVICVSIFIGNIAMLVEYVKKKGKKNDN